MGSSSRPRNKRTKRVESRAEEAESVGEIGEGFKRRGEKVIADCDSAEQEGWIRT